MPNNKQQNKSKLTRSCKYKTIDTMNLRKGQYCIECYSDTSHHIDMYFMIRNMTGKIISVLCSGGVIKETGDLFAMINIEQSRALARSYSRKRGNLYHIISNIAKEDILNSLKTIEAIIICENGLEYYLELLAKNEDKRDPVKFTTSFHFTKVQDRKE